jgi:pyrroloquinoline quinone (PQQ) biosynthesis protein C
MTPLQVPTREALLRLFDEWGRRHPLHTHAYLDALFDPTMNDMPRIQSFVEVLYVFCERFHDCTWAIGLNTRDDNIRRALADNLYDEYGSGDKDHAHLGLMRQLLYSLGYTDEMLRAIRLNRGAQRFMDEILRVCQEEHPLEAFGCVFMGAECNGSTYFRKIYEAFRKKACLHGADLEILEIHAGDDVQHRQRMLSLVERYLDDPDNRRRLLDGYLLSIQLFQELWTSMQFYEDAVVTNNSSASKSFDFSVA